MMKYYYVYILKCSDSSYYTGLTNNIERRFQEHQSGENNTFFHWKMILMLIFSFYQWTYAIGMVNDVLTKTTKFGKMFYWALLVMALCWETLHFPRQ